ncbi:MAG: insulinase family protein [Desulfobulbaceae bacterium]|nr:insulinase family protein [Desulfobulbaceae bacterium]
MNSVYKNIYNKITPFIFFVIFFLGCPPDGLSTQLQAAAEQSTCITEGWPHEVSDLEPDPQIIFGRLDNGFRYLILENKEPKNRAGLYLNIQAGSLNEKDKQRGLAHFLEHMLFNGTANYPPGELIRYFQSIGMSFGADTNAMTNFMDTVYNVILPTGNRQHLDEGLLVMADYARRALLLEQEVDRERGIILAEKRTRDSAGYRLYEKKTQFHFAGTRVTDRMPIGTEETLEEADAEILRDFYNTWYRPENTILVIVGDVDPETVKELVVKHFAGFRNPEITPGCYEFGQVPEEGTDILYVHEPEVGYTEVSISTRWNESPGRDSVARQTRDLKNYVAASLLNKRLKKIVNRADSPVTSAQVYAGIFLQQVGYATVTARTKGEKWEDGLKTLDKTLRQALEFGFSEQELVRVRKEIIADLEKQVKIRESRDSRKLARDIINKVSSNQVFLSPEQELRLYAPVLQALTVEDVNRVFRELWSHENRQVFVGGTAVVAASRNQEDVVRQVYLDSRKQTPEKWVNGEEIAFPYLPVAEKSVAAVENIEVPGIDARQIRFANGTVLNIKKTDYQPNEILLSVHFGPGRHAEPHAGLSLLAEAVVRESGYGRLTRDELEEALAGTSASLSFKAGEESFELTGKGLSGEFELLLQLVQAQLLDPAFREDAYSLSRYRFNQMYDQLRSSVDGMMRLAGERFLAGGNPHFGLPPQDQFNDLTLPMIGEWLLPIFKDAQLEVNVVGDFDIEQVIVLTGRYLGAMERKTMPAPALEKISFPVGGQLKEEVSTQIDKALVVVAWPTDDFWDISRTRRLNVLASIFSDLVRIEIRENLGAVYSPVVYNQPSRVADGYGVMRTELTVDPQFAEVIRDKVRDVGAELAEKGVTEDELLRALEPTLTSIKDMLRTNRYWMQSVLALSSRHPEQLAWPLTIESDFAAITTEEVEQLAAQYLVPEKSAAILFSPAAIKEENKALPDNP